MIPRITTPIRMPDERLWELHAKHANRTITGTEKLELDCRCAAMEAEQDNFPVRDRAGDINPVRRDGDDA